MDGADASRGSWVTVQTGSKLEAFFAAFSRKTRVQRRAAQAKRIGIAARKRYMSTPFEGAWTVTQLAVHILYPAFAFFHLSPYTIKS